MVGEGSSLTDGDDGDGDGDIKYSSGDLGASGWSWSTNESFAGKVFTSLLCLFFLCFISGVVIFCIRIKYRLFAGQGEGKSFTDARQVKILFHHNMNKSKNMIIMSCFHVDSTLLIHNKMPSHHQRVLSCVLKRISRGRKDSESGDSFVHKSCFHNHFGNILEAFQSLFGNLSQSVLIF